MRTLHKPNMLHNPITSKLLCSAICFTQCLMTGYTISQNLSSENTFTLWAVLYVKDDLNRSRQLMLSFGMRSLMIRKINSWFINLSFFLVSSCLSLCSMCQRWWLVHLTQWAKTCWIILGWVALVWHCLIMCFYFIYLDLYLTMMVPSVWNSRESWPKIAA